MQLLLYSRGKRPRYPLERRLGGFDESRFGHYEDEKNLVPARNRAPDAKLVASRYTDLVIPFPQSRCRFKRRHTR
jgi:hypothetical protein